LWGAVLQGFRMPDQIRYDEEVVVGRLY